MLYPLYLTLISGIGSSLNISGAYKASTRAGGSWNSPGVVQPQGVFRNSSPLGNETVIFAVGFKGTLLKRPAKPGLRALLRAS